MSRKIFVIIAGLAFLMSLISVYFGTSIYNANENLHVQHLNEMDRLSYYNADDVPVLTKIAALATLPFMILIFGFEIYVLRKTEHPVARKIAISVAAMVAILAILAILTLNNASFFDFSKWGFAWVFVGLFTIAGNALSVFLKKS